MLLCFRKKVGKCNVSDNYNLYAVHIKCFSFFIIVVELNNKINNFGGVYGRKTSDFIEHYN